MMSTAPDPGVIERQRVFITGGTGFVGSGIVSSLNNVDLTLLARSPDKVSSTADFSVVQGDVTNPSSLVGKLDGFDTVIHLVAIIEEHGSATFDSVIHQGTVNVVQEAKRAGVRHFIHMSALGATNDPRYAYHSAKWKAEQAVKSSGVPYTIFRPSVIFGPDDGFINALAGLVRTFPVVPVVGSGQSRFQPVSLQDVADAFARAVADPATTQGQTYELGGARAYTYEEMLDVIASEMGKKRPKVHLPVGLMKLVVAASSPLPKKLRPPVTSEQLKMLALDNSTAESAIESLIGRAPVSLEDGIAYVREGRS